VIMLDNLIWHSISKKFIFITPSLTTKICRVRLFIIVSCGVILLQGCEADMTTNNSDYPKAHSSKTGDCPVDRLNKTAVKDPSSVLSGASIEIHVCEKDRFNGYAERFYTDGRWELDEFGTVLITHIGTWHSKNKKIITFSKKKGEHERDLFRNENGIYFLKAIIPFDSGTDDGTIPISISNVRQAK
jgi:hypothetical protein